MMKNSWPEAYFEAAAGTDDLGDLGNNEPNPNDANPVNNNNDDPVVMKQQLDYWQRNNELMKNELWQLRQQVANMQTGNSQPPPQPTAPPDSEEVDYEALTPTQLAKQLKKDILGAIKQEFTPQLQQVQTTFQQTQQSMMQREAERQVQVCMAKYPDFTQFANSMAMLAQQRPGLQVEDYYAIAKLQSGAMNPVRPNPPQPRVITPPKGTERPGGGTTQVEEGQFNDMSSAFEAALAKVPGLQNR